MPAKAGIQCLAQELGPRFRGDERDVPHIFTSTIFPSFTCAVRNATSMMLPLSANLHGPEAPEYLISLPSAISFKTSSALCTTVPDWLLLDILRMLSRIAVPDASLPFAIARIARLAWS